MEWVYDNHNQLQRPLGNASLADLIFARCFADLAGAQMRRFRLLKDLGHMAVHRKEPIRPGDAVTAAKELFQVLRWLVRSYGLDPGRLRGLAFDANQLPGPDSAGAEPAQSREQLEALAAQLAERDQQLRDQRLAAVVSQEELDRLCAEVTALRKANETANQPEADATEFDTRRGYTGHYLEEAGWEHGSSGTHEHEVQGFYKKEELTALIRRRELRQPLAEAPVSTTIAGRYPQQRAIRAIAISLTELLSRCNWIKRVLFLADRTSLVLQAKRAFRNQLPDCAPVNLVTNKGGEGRVFLSTYPTMLNLIDADDGHGVRRLTPSPSTCSTPASTSRRSSIWRSSSRCAPAPSTGRGWGGHPHLPKPLRTRTR